MRHKRAYPLLGKPAALRRAMVATATALAVASSALADQIAGGSMTVSTSSTAWSLFTSTMRASGSFFGTDERPANYLLGGGLIGNPGTVYMNWFSDSVDGWSGAMTLNDGVTYRLGSSGFDNSYMIMTAAPMTFTSVGTYHEPFTFFARFCGFLSLQSELCDATLLTTGHGTLTVVIGPYPFLPSELAIESMNWRFSNVPVPEPATLALLATGLVALGLSRRSI